MMAHQEDDIVLLRQFRNESTRELAFTRIVTKYQEQLYWHIRKIVVKHEDADDVIQNMFIKVWRKLDTFKGDSELYTWLYRIATNEALTYLRKKKKDLFVSLDESIKEFESTGYNGNGFSGDEILQKLHKAVLGLPEKQRIVFNMKYFDDKKYDEMSEILETSVGALKASYHHAVKKIEKSLTNG